MSNSTGAMDHRRAKPRRRTLMAVVGVLSGAALGLAAVVMRPAPPASAQGAPNAGPPPVTVSKPVVKATTDWDEYTGRFEPVERVDVRARVGGYLVGIHFKDGQLVKTGDLLFTIDPDTYEVAVEAAKADLARAEAQREFAIADLERARQLVTSRTLPARDFDTRRSAQKQAEAGVASARAALRSAELNLRYTKITSPITGRVSAAAIDVGNLVQVGTTDASVLTRIVSADPVHFVFEVNETNYLRYRRLVRSNDAAAGGITGHQVQVRLSDETAFAHTGRLEFVDVELRSGTGTIRARAVLDNPKGAFTPGMFGRLRLAASPEYQAVLIPEAAVVTDQNRRLVYVVKPDNTVEPRPVQLGSLSEGLRVVREGLAPDDRIVVSGLQRVRPGAKVQPVEAAPGSMAQAAAR